MSEQGNAIGNFAETYERIWAEIAKEMIGQDAVVEHLLEAVIAGGNVLLEGVPGLAKPTWSGCWARCWTCLFPVSSSRRT